MTRLLLLAIAVPTLAHAASAPKVTKADFAAIFQKNPVSQVSLSPDGTHLAYMVREKEKEFLYIVDIHDPGKHFAMRAQGMRYHAWTSSSTLLYAPPQEIRVMNADGTGDRKLVDGHDVAYYWGVSENKVEVIKERRRTPVVVGMVPSQPGKLVISATGQMEMYAGASSTNVDFYQVDTATGKLDHLLNKYHEGVGFADQQGNIRLYRNASQELRPGMWINVPQKYTFWNSGDAYFKNLDDVLGEASGFHFEIQPGEYFGQDSVPLAFGADPNLLYVASNLGRDKYGIYGLDLVTHRQTGLKMEDPVWDLASPDDAFGKKPLVFDRNGSLAGIETPGPTHRWQIPELAQAQTRLDQLFPGRTIRLVDWSTDWQRILFVASSATDPGRYFVFDANSGQCAEFLRMGGEIDLQKMGAASSFEFNSPSGVHLTGTITQPKNPVINPPPLVVYCRNFPSAPPADGFDPDAQALAAIGFIVVEVNHRGMIGFGQKHLNAVLDGLDRVPLEDIRATIEWVAAKQKIDRSRIAIVGEGMGGFLAVRALELFPEEFRCAVTINAPADISDWLLESIPGRIEEGTERIRTFLNQAQNLGNYSAIADAKLITKPVLVMQEERLVGIPIRQGKLLRDAVRSSRGDVDYVTLNTGFKNRDPGARAAAYLEIADFMRNNLYEFNVRIGPVQTVK